MAKDEVDSSPYAGGAGDLAVDSRSCAPIVICFPSAAGSKKPNRERLDEAAFEPGLRSRVC